MNDAKKHRRVRKRPEPLSRAIQLILDDQSAEKVLSIRRRLQKDLSAFSYLNWPEAHPHVGISAFGNMNVERVERLLRDRFRERTRFTLRFGETSEFSRDRKAGESFIVHFAVEKSQALGGIFDDIRGVVSSVGGTVVEPISFGDWAPHLTLLRHARPQSLPYIREAIARAVQFPFEVRVGSIRNVQREG